MNIERLTKLAEWLEGGAKHETITFDILKGVRFARAVANLEDIPDAITCGTTCCIAGAAVQFFNDLPKMTADNLSCLNNSLFGDDFEIPWIEVRSEAIELLELDDGVADCLFEPWHRQRYKFVYGKEQFNNAAWAGRTIRRLIATGEVDWTATYEAKAVAA